MTLGVRDAVEYPAVAGLEAHAGSPVPGRPVAGIRLSGESHTDERVRRLVPVPPQPALLAGGLMPQLAGQRRPRAGAVDSAPHLRQVGTRGSMLVTQ